jgi:hypothetical protein
MFMIMVTSCVSLSFLFAVGFNTPELCSGCNKIKINKEKVCVRRLLAAVYNHFLALATRTAGWH